MGKSNPPIPQNNSTTLTRELGDILHSIRNRLQVIMTTAEYVELEFKNKEISQEMIENVADLKEATKQLNDNLIEFGQWLNKYFGIGMPGRSSKP